MIGTIESFGQKAAYIGCNRWRVGIWYRVRDLSPFNFSVIKGKGINVRILWLGFTYKFREYAERGKSE